MTYAPIGSSKDCRELIDICLKAHRYELLSMLLEGERGRLKLCIVEPNFIVDPNLLRLSGCVVIGIGDYSKQKTGPTYWAQAPQLASWSDATLLQCTRGYAKYYEWITKNAVQGKRTLIIETDLWHLAAWTDLLESHKRKQSELLIAVPTNSSAARIPNRTALHRGEVR